MARITAKITDDDSEISAINITPLVDVVLVLLIIFMITAPALYQNALRVQLPKAKTADGESKKSLEVLVDRKGDIHIQGKILSIASSLYLLPKNLKI